MNAKSELDKAFESLKAQGIEARQGGVTRGGTMSWLVMGFMLTNEQIVELYDAGKLNTYGIGEFAAEFEKRAKSGTGATQ